MADAQTQLWKNWIKKHSATRNKTYYFNKSTGQSQWTAPDGWPSSGVVPPPSYPKTPPKKSSKPSTATATTTTSPAATSLSKLNAKSRDIKRKTPAQDRLSKLQQNLIAERVAKDVGNNKMAKATADLLQQVKVIKPSSTKEAAAAPKKLPLIPKKLPPIPKKLPPTTPKKPTTAKNSSPKKSSLIKKQLKDNRNVGPPPPKSVPKLPEPIPQKAKKRAAPATEEVVPNKKPATIVQPKPVEMPKTSAVKPEDKPLLSYEEATIEVCAPNAFLNVFSGVKNWVQQQFAATAAAPISLPTTKNVFRFSAVTPSAAATLGSSGRAACPRTDETISSQFDEDVEMTDDDDMTSDSNGKWCRTVVGHHQMNNKISFAESMEWEVQSAEEQPPATTADKPVQPPPPITFTNQLKLQLNAFEPPLTPNQTVPLQAFSSMPINSPLSKRLMATSLPEKVPIDMSYVNQAAVKLPLKNDDNSPPPVSNSFSIVVDTNIFIQNLSFIRRLIEQGCSANGNRINIIFTFFKFNHFCRAP